MTEQTKPLYVLEQDIKDGYKMLFSVYGEKPLNARLDMVNPDGSIAYSLAVTDERGCYPIDDPARAEG